MPRDLRAGDEGGVRGASAERGTEVRGAVQVDVHAAVRADPARFVELALDLDQLVALHPRLLHARWLDAPGGSAETQATAKAPKPPIGARAEIHVALPAVLGLLSAIVGQPRGTLTLLDHHPGRSVRYRLDADRVAGVVELVAAGGEGDGEIVEGAEPDATTSQPARAVTVRGALWAKAPLARAAMVPSLPLLEPAMTAAVRRTIVRADELLAGD